MRPILALLFAIASIAPAQRLDFVHISDTHLFDPAGLHPAIAILRGPLALARGRLDELTHQAGTRPAFFLATGDLVDGYCFDTPAGQPLCDQIQLFRTVAKSSPVRIYPALGNHDVTIYHPPKLPALGLVHDLSHQAEARAAWRQALPDFRRATYYSFQKRVGPARYRFIVLDNGDTSDAVFVAAQLRWLESELRRSREETVILVLHIPLAGDAFSKSVLRALAGHPAALLALAGHRHTDGIEEFGSLVQVRTAGFATSGFVERRIALLSDRIEIYATGKPAQLLRTIQRKPKPASANPSVRGSLGGRSGGSVRNSTSTVLGSPGGSG